MHFPSTILHLPLSFYLHYSLSRASLLLSFISYSPTTFTIFHLALPLNYPPSSTLLLPSLPSIISHFPSTIRHLPLSYLHYSPSRTSLLPCSICYFCLHYPPSSRTFLLLSAMSHTPSTFISLHFSLSLYCPPSPTLLYVHYPPSFRNSLLLSSISYSLSTFTILHLVLPFYYPLCPTVPFLVISSISSHSSLFLFFCASSSFSNFHTPTFISLLFLPLLLLPLLLLWDFSCCML